jgi:glycosyltransferase involved in cell wall biosynthesis
MRIAFFSTMAGHSWGGSEELWSRAAMALVERGHSVAFNCVEWPIIAAPLQRLIDHGVLPHFRSRRRIGRTLRQTLQKLRLVRLKHMRWLQKCRPDFVVISFACHTDDPQIAITCHRLGIPYAILLQAAGAHTWIEPRSLPDFRSAYTRAAQCFFVSAENREVMQSNLAVDLSWTEIVDNPFTVSVNAGPDWPPAQPYWKLACVARVHFASKSQDLLVRVLCRPKWRARPLKVVLWGSDHGNLNQLRRLIDLNALQEQIEYGGVASDIEQLWSKHHGLLLPSRHEGNALSLIEAMMCSRVPITTKAGRAAELINDNETGFLAPAATAELIDLVLERAWHRRSDWRTMGERAGHAIREHHSVHPGEDFANRIFDVASQRKSGRKQAA